VNDIKIETASNFTGKIHRTEFLMQRAFCFIGTPGTEKTRTLRTFKPPDWKPGDHPWAYIFAMDRKKDGGMAVLRGVEGIDYNVFVNPEMHHITALGQKYEYPEPHALGAVIIILWPSTPLLGLQT
jgi:hypothetical protein